MKLKGWALSLIIMVSAFSMAHAQEKDSLIYNVRPDTAKSKFAKADSTKSDTLAHKKHVHHPMSKYDKAALMSAIVPGLGQIGHKDAWWHVPIIYAGFAVMGYIIYDQNNQYQLYRGYYQTRLKTDADTSNHHYDPLNELSPIAGPKETTDQLLSDREFYQRNRDLTIIISVIWYAANIIDSYVAAQLRDFDISNNLSMHFDPINISLIGNQPVVTCGLKFNLK